MQAMNIDQPAADVEIVTHEDILWWRGYGHFQFNRGSVDDLATEFERMGYRAAQQAQGWREMVNEDYSIEDDAEFNRWGGR